MCVGGLAKTSSQPLLRPWEEKDLETYFGPLPSLSPSYNNILKTFSSLLQA